ncbi:hypothetical protein L9G16_05410 [Shewanella sp. A25]|nr:hypothetical protein [Shewanella shenzhenensis]
MVFNIIKRLFSGKGHSSNSNDRPVVKSSVPINYEINIARDLLKEATQLKRDKKYIEACEKLKEAYSADGSENIMIEERLRLPMYLQLAGNNDEGWKILNELNITYLDVFSQLKIADQMRIFLQKEKKYKNAILFGSWVICKRIEVAKYNIQSSKSIADEMSKFSAEFNVPGFNDENAEIFDYTEKGNPITDPSYKMFKDQIEKDVSLEGVKDALLPLLKKAKLDSSINNMASELSIYLNSTNNYDLSEVRNIVLKTENKIV